MEIRIKNMVCNQCIKAVERILADMDMEFNHVELGLVVTDRDIPKETLRHLDGLLGREGFERIEDKDEVIVETIKRVVRELVRDNSDSRQKLSAAITGVLPYPYETLSRLFSAREGRTLEKYYIAMKIEYVKELIGYNQQTLSEIAYNTGFSSVAHLSKRFKEVTGMTPSKYKELQLPRKTLPEV